MEGSLFWMEKYRTKDNLQITGDQDYGNSIIPQEKLNRQVPITTDDLMDCGNGIMKMVALLREEEYFQGQRDGSFTEYSPTGEIISQGQYTDGEKNDMWKYKSGR